MLGANVPMSPCPFVPFSMSLCSTFPCSHVLLFHVPMSPCPRVPMSPSPRVPMSLCPHVLVSSYPRVLMSLCPFVPMSPCLPMSPHVPTSPHTPPCPHLSEQLCHHLHLLSPRQQVAQRDAGDARHLHVVHQHHQPLQQPQRQHCVLQAVQRQAAPRLIRAVLGAEGRGQGSGVRGVMGDMG